MAERRQYGAGPDDGRAPSPILAEALRLIEVAEIAGVPLRLVGGLAVQARSHGWLPAEREQRDIDLAARRRDRAAIVDILEGLNYQADRRFNALHGHKQLYFVDARTNTPLDVILDELDMCHKLDFTNRLEIDHLTLPLADLVLTKLQIVRVNRKDLIDVMTLMHGYPLTPGDERGINVDRIVSVTRDDWGWWRTVRGNLVKGLEILGLERPLGPEPLSPESHARIADGLNGLLRAIDVAPKSLRWKLRARVGERVRWYEEPEEEEHG